MAYSNSLEVTNSLLVTNNLQVANSLQVTNSLLFVTTLPTLPTPTFNPVAGAYGPSQSVTITSANSTAIYYTTDGSTPTTGSTLYSGPVTVSSSETLKALATAASYNNSAVGSAAYTINGAVGTPVFSPVAGTYLTFQSVTITSSTSTEIYYTTDGSTPTIPPTGTSTLYSGAISVVSSETIKAIGGATNWSNSAVASSAYVISTLVAAWEMTDGSGTVATDSSASGNNLTITPGTGSWSTLAGVSGGVYSFDGTTTKMVAGNNTNVNFNYNQPFSVFSVVYMTDTTSERMIVGTGDPASNYNGWWIESYQGHLWFYLIGTLSPSHYISTNSIGSLNASTLYDVVATYDGSGTAAGVTLYINGIAQTVHTDVDTLSSTSTTSMVYPTVGQRAGSVQLAAGSEVGPIYVWKRVLTAGEASALHSNFYAPPN